jgi:hypothetical protein
MNTVTLNYDSDHHVTAIKQPQNKVVNVDCPYMGDGEEFSPADSLCIALGSCMLSKPGKSKMPRNCAPSGQILAPIRLFLSSLTTTHKCGITYGF